MKSLVVAAALSLLATSALAAPPDQSADTQPQAAHAHSRFSAEDAAAMADARLAALKAGLKLTPEQEKHWPALETTLRDIGKARVARYAEYHDKTKADERDALKSLREQSKMLTTRAAEMTKIADSAKPLYDSLDKSQKRRFGMLMHQASSMHRQWGWRRHRFGDDG